MDSNQNKIVILMADDDPDDRLMAMEALEESHLNNELHLVEDGEELFNYLKRKGKYKDLKKYPKPGIILLDLNMPKKDGRQTLKELKEDEELRKIPVIILTTSKAEEDILRTYDLGANSFITKPVTFEGLVEVIKKLGEYWFEIVKLPDK